jgi:hypothetical protein
VTDVLQALSILGLDRIRRLTVTLAAASQTFGRVLEIDSTRQVLISPLSQKWSVFGYFGAFDVYSVLAAI